ncbi:MAG: alpha/beta hydrolase [Actinomycetota bacterium]|nr:alpha/beta hydrolase [Actinomycetota bacterium]
MEELDLGICRAQLFQGEHNRAALLLPGARYVPAAPLLWFTREVLQARKWTVLQVWDEWDRSDDPTQWVADRLEAGLTHLGDHLAPLLVAKSLSTLALPEAIERGLSGIWLTPLLAQAAVRSALTENLPPSLVVGGTGDPTWDSEFVAQLATVEVLEIEGADHGLQFPGEPHRSLDALKIITDRTGQFVDQFI